MNTPLKIPATVGVIASEKELRTAARMRKPPDLFELRLDCAANLDIRKIARLRRPLIITARHPAEGGHLLQPPILSRRELLLKWLPHAQFVDVELRSLGELRDVWNKAARFKIKRICSVHDFVGTPSHAVLQKQFDRAKSAGADIFKLVTRAKTPDDLLTLLQFLRGKERDPRARRLPACVMAAGELGPVSRLLFGQCGSVLVYAPLHRPLHSGQLTLAKLRRQIAALDTSVDWLGRLR